MGLVQGALQGKPMAMWFVATHSNRPFR